MGKIGILGGTFDPPHLGHINLAIGLMEAHQLDEVWFCPAYINPFKQGQQSASVEDRLAMLALAIQDVPQFKAIDIECRRKDVSYTIDTLRAITALYPQHQFYLLLGSDTAHGLSHWRQPEAIIQLATVLVGCRQGTDATSAEGANSDILRAIAQGKTVIPLMDISSTEIRHRLKTGRYCGHLLPSKVVDYITYHHLYLILLGGPS